MLELLLELLEDSSALGSTVISPRGLLLQILPCFPSSYIDGTTPKMSSFDVIYSETTVRIQARRICSFERTCHAGVRDDLTSTDLTCWERTVHTAFLKEWWP